jgi:hypothetical protein
MAEVRIVTNKNETVVRRVTLPLGVSVATVDQAATALESVINEEKLILHIEVDYEGCDDSKTV